MAKKKSSKDVNVTAFEILQAVTGRPTDSYFKMKSGKKIDRPNKNPAAVALGRLGGLKGGKVRAERLSAARRKQIAKRAAKIRWKARNA